MDYILSIYLAADDFENVRGLSCYFEKRHLKISPDTKMTIPKFAAKFVDKIIVY